MTTLISWISYDQRSPASIYIASDSRFNWDGKAFWDSGRKIYFSNKYPDILGFCGDVLFCSQLLSQIISYIDSCDIFEESGSSDSRSELVYSLIKRSFGSYPASFALETFQILYVTRQAKKEFHVYVIEWVKDRVGEDKWKKIKIKIPDKTGIIQSLGSGGDKYIQHYGIFYGSSDVYGLSRSYYFALNSHIESGEDSKTGGPIQLAGLFNEGSAKIHGVIKNEKRYLYGMEIDPHQKLNLVRWVNDRFENCDGFDTKRQFDAQIQPLPKNNKQSTG